MSEDATPHYNAVLCRTNAGCIAAALEYGQAGQSFALLVSGGINALKSLAFAVSALQNSETTEHPDFVGFNDWEEVREYAASAEGIDMRPTVNLFDKYGVAAIQAVCMNSLPEDKAGLADIQIVTAHRSKGLEWDRVVIYPDWPHPSESEDSGSDFDSSEDGNKLSLAELRLAYVAITRARLHINAAAVLWMLDPAYEIADKEV